jgi:hypothetical protein
LLLPVTRVVTAVAQPQRREPAMPNNIWNDDDSWWHQLDLEMQRKEEEEREQMFAEWAELEEAAEAERELALQMWAELEVALKERKENDDAE